MPMMFSSVVVFGNGCCEEFIVPGIPSQREDLETADGYEEFAKQFTEKTLLSAKVQTYTYSETEDGIKDYPDLIARIKRDFRFTGEHCKHCRTSEFKFWIG